MKTTVSTLEDTATYPRKNGPAPRPLKDRFLEKVKVLGPNECWMWTGAVGNNGYGKFRYGTARVNRNSYSAHRIAYVLFRGEIPNNLHVCHHCDVKLCMNPDHLFLGTNKDNHVDASLKGRLSHPNPWCAKLTSNEVVEIKNLIDSNPSLSLSELARMYNVSLGSIRSIAHGKTWKHIN